MKSTRYSLDFKGNFAVSLYKCMHINKSIKNKDGKTIHRLPTVLPLVMRGENRIRREKRLKFFFQKEKGGGTTHENMFNIIR